MSSWTLAELIEFAEGYPCLCALNYPGTTEYHGHDCQTDIVQEFVAQFVSMLEERECQT